MNYSTTTLNVNAFKKAGFVHHNDLDFSDDGTNFKVLSLDGIFVSFAKDDNNVYVDMDMYQSGLDYNDYRTLASADLIDAFNGVRDYTFDMDTFIDNIHQVVADINDNNRVDLVTKATGVNADNSGSYSLVLDQDTDFKVYRSKASKAVLASMQNGDILLTIDDVQNLLDLMKAVDRNA